MSTKHESEGEFRYNVEGFMETGTARQTAKAPLNARPADLQPEEPTEEEARKTASEEKTS